MINGLATDCSISMLFIGGFVVSCILKFSELVNALLFVQQLDFKEAITRSAEP